MSEKYTINSEYDICFDGKVYIANKNLNSLCYIQLFCRLLNENEKRKSSPKIDVDTDDMVSILGILENNISMILHLRPELGKTYNYDFVNRMKSKYYEKTRNLLGLE